MLVVAMEPRDFIALSGVAASVIVAIAGFVYSSVMQQRKQQHDDALHKDQLEREDKLREIYRQDIPHIEFAVDCRVHGQQGADLLVEFILTAHNRGLVQWKFRRIILRVRGIEEDQPLTYWEENIPRLEFPIEIIDSIDVIPSNLNFLFVEPSVKQTITYVTKISSRIRYIVVYAEFQYDKYTPHSSERVFRLTYIEERDI